MPWQNRLVISLMKKEKVVYKIPRIGLQLKKLTRNSLCRRNCGRQNESQSHSRIYEKNAPKQTWLITDEAAANEILKRGNPLK